MKGIQTLATDWSGIGNGLTISLSAFNAQKHVPMILGGEVVETPTGAEFGSTITDWKTVVGGDVTAD